MDRIYIETNKKTTHEHVFLDIFLRHIGCTEYEIIDVGGKDRLCEVKNKMAETTIEGGRNFIVFDADEPANGGGFNVRKQQLLGKIEEMGVRTELFLFPNNHDDGDLEVLLESIAQKQDHQSFFDCFEDFERCIGDAYLHPNRKGKLFTYINSQKTLSHTQRNKIGSGDWFYEDKRFWDLDSEKLEPLKVFLRGNKTIEEKIIS